jgi:hypothetical protein
MKRNRERRLGVSDLIVFYSFSGKSRQVAEWLGAALRADLAEIVEERPRNYELGGFVKCGLDSFLRRRPAIKPMARRAAAYDRVILACPVWIGRVAGPARTWLRAEGPDAKVLGLALQSGGGVAYGAVLNEIEAVTGRKPDPLLILSEADFGNKIAGGKVEAFAKGIVPTPAKFAKN